jgi:hypothetical protein
MEITGKVLTLVQADMVACRAILSCHRNGRRHRGNTAQAYRCHGQCHRSSETLKFTQRLSRDLGMHRSKLPRTCQCSQARQSDTQLNGHVHLLAIPPQ